jgi:hypothetical protein
MATESNTRHLPKGTLGDLREAHLDPAMYGCCHANAADSNGLTIMGCMVEKSCPFAQKRYGGFKGEGPEYIGYYHRTTRADESKQMENVISCFGFVQTLLRRMRKGMTDKEEGRDYEHIEIIAMPKSVLARDPSLKGRFSDTVVVTRWKSEAPKSLVNMSLVSETVEMEVPHFPRPQENPGITHNQKLAARLAARESARNREDDAPESREDRLDRIKAELAEMDANTPEADAEVLDAFSELPARSGEAPVAEPVARKK